MEQVISQKIYSEPLLEAAISEKPGKEARLLAGLRKQNRRALEQVIAQYTPYVATILRNLTRGQTTQEDLEELTADVFLSLWQHAPEIRSDHLTGYLASIARSKGCNWLRKKRLETQPLEEELHLADDTDVAEQAEQDEQARLLAELLELLSKQDREILIRFYYYRQTVREIAGELHLKEATVKTRMHRSRKKLQQLFLERGYVT